MRVQKEHAVRTIRLDDIAEVADVRSAENGRAGSRSRASVSGAARVLADTSIVQTEVSFVEMYKGQCLFADVDTRAA